MAWMVKISLKKVILISIKSICSQLSWHCTGYCSITKALRDTGVHRCAAFEWCGCTSMFVSCFKLYLDM